MSLFAAIGCGSGNGKPSEANTKIEAQKETLRKLDSDNEKERIEGAREAAQQFGEQKKEE